MTILTHEHVLRLSLARWGVTRLIDYRRMLGRGDLDVSQPLALTLPEDLGAALIQIDDPVISCVTLINSDRTGDVEVPVHDPAESFYPLRVGSDIPPTGERIRFAAHRCFNLSDLLDEVYRDAVSAGLIHPDTYDAARYSINRLT